MMYVYNDNERIMRDGVRVAKVHNWHIESWNLNSKERGTVTQAEHFAVMAVPEPKFLACNIHVNMLEK